MKFTVFDFDKRTPRGVLRMNDTIGSRKRFETSSCFETSFWKISKGVTMGSSTYPTHSFGVSRGLLYPMPTVLTGT